MQTPTSSTAFLPNFCGIRLIFAWVVTAELLAIVLTLAAEPQDFWNSLSLRSLYVQWVALGLAGVLCLSGRWINGLGHTWAGIGVWLLSLLMTALVFLVSRYLLRETPLLDWTTLLHHLGLCAIVSAIALRYLYEVHREQERRAAGLQARAQALQARIRPHFLFNSMNTIASLTRTDARLAEEVVHDLSDLFRASLADSERLSTLQQELELARGYLHIEEQRLGERLQVAWDLQGLPEHAPMPALLLQPLLENAVYHGIEPALHGGTIEISGRYRRGLVNIAISNPIPEGRAERDGNRMAQQNVRERLQAVFPEQGDLHIGEVEGRYQVRMVFPCEETSA
jgi:two-component system sensor histidine kinase AlgZ